MHHSNIQFMKSSRKFFRLQNNLNEMTWGNGIRIYQRNKARVLL